MTDDAISQQNSKACQLPLIFERPVAAAPKSPPFKLRVIHGGLATEQTTSVFVGPRKLDDKAALEKILAYSRGLKW